MIAPRTGAFSVLYGGFVRGADWSTERGAFAAHIYDLGSMDGLYGIYEVRTEGVVEALRTGDPIITDSPMPVLSWSPNGQSLVWGGSCCPCQLGVIGAGTVGQTGLGAGCQIGNVRWSADSRYLLVEKGQPTEPPFSGAFVVLDVETGEQIASGRIPIQGDEGNQAAWSISAGGAMWRESNRGHIEERDLGWPSVTFDWGLLGKTVKLSTAVQQHGVLRFRGLGDHPEPAKLFQPQAY